MNGEKNDDDTVIALNQFATHPQFEIGTPESEQLLVGTLGIPKNCIELYEPSDDMRIRISSPPANIRHLAKTKVIVRCMVTVKKNRKKNGKKNDGEFYYDRRCIKLYFKETVTEVHGVVVKPPVFRSVVVHRSTEKVSHSHCPILLFSPTYVPPSHVQEYVQSTGDEIFHPTRPSSAALRNDIVALKNSRGGTVWLGASLNDSVKPSTVSFNFLANTTEADLVKLIGDSTSATIPRIVLRDCESGGDTYSVMSSSSMFLVRITVFPHDLSRVYFPSEPHLPFRTRDGERGVSVVHNVEQVMDSIRRMPPIKPPFPLQQLYDSSILFTSFAHIISCLISAVT